jgi:hypothetical protein
MKKLFMFLIATVFVVLQTQAQTAGQYGFSTATNSSLIDMSSGTTNIFATGTYRDDDASALQTIDFTFRFCGTDYTQYSINSNGQMRLGSTVIAGGSTSAGSNTPMIIPLSGDNSLQSAGKVHFKVLGSAPDRILVVEWDKVRVNYSSSDVTGPFCTFQVLLYETSNVINFIYGTMYNRSTSSQSRSVGISNSNSTGTVGYVATITTTPTFTSASSYGTTSFVASSNMINLNSSANGSRRIFTFTPPNPCSTPIDQPTNLAFSNITSSTLTGTYTPATGSDSYLVVRSLDASLDANPVDLTTYAVGGTLGTNGTIVYSGSAATFNATSLLPSTKYYFFVFSMNSSCTGGPLYLTSSSPLSLDITTGPSAPLGFTAAAVSSSEISFTATPNATDDWVLIAWNSTNTFGNPSGIYNAGDPLTGGGEILYYGKAATAPNHTGLTSATTYYYKIWSELNTLYSSGLTANATTQCSNITTFPYNEPFNTFLPSVCWKKAQGILASPVTFTSTSSAWAADGFAQVGSSGAAGLNIWSTSKYEWLISPSVDLGTNNDKRLVFDLALNVYNTASPAGTSGIDDKFAVVISTDNGVTWDAANSIKIWDNAGSPNIYNNISSTGEQVIIDLSAYTGVIKIGFYGESTISNADNDVTIDNFVIENIPACPYPTTLAANNITAHQADLAWTENGTSASWDIEWGATPFTPTGTPTITGVTNPYTLTGLTQTTGYAYYVRANCGGSYSTWSGPKTFTTPVSCPAPTALSATNITTTSADLGWTNPSGSTWNIEWGVTGFTPTGTPTITGITTNPYTLNGLSASTTYQFYVLSDCGVIDGSSTWAGPYAFTTLCDAQLAPFIQNFESATFAPVCWTNSAVTGTYTWSRSTAASGNGVGTASAYANFYGQSSGSYELKTVSFDISSLASPTLKFNYAYATYSGEVDALEVYYSTDNGFSWTILLNMPGGASGILNTAGTTTSVFTPTAAQWGFQQLALPAGTNMIKFKAISAYGNNLYLDNIQVYSPQANVWAGNTSNDWATATNWDNNIVPTSSSNVIIPATAPRFPTLTAPVTINKLTVESNASGTGSLLDNGYLTMTGSATVNQYVQGEKWHLISSPVQNATAGVFHLASGQADIYIREFVGGAWTYITNLTTPIVTNKGYGIWADTQTNSTPHPTVPFVGALNTGVQLLPTTGGSAWDLLGNPYVSAINWNTVNTANVAGGAVRVWNQALTLYSAYSSIGGSVNGGNQFLAPMQGFFVQTTDANGISLDNTNRVHNGQLFLKSTNTISDLVKITAQRGSYKDEINVVMNPIATNNYDVQYDASKLFANDNNIPEIYTTSGNHNLVINIFKNAPIAIPMNIRLGVSDNVTLTASEFANFDANVSIKLEDLLLGTTQDLRLNPSYTFAASIGDNANRFILHFATATGINENNGGNTSIYAYDNTIYVNTTEQVKEINIYNMLGQVITSVAGNGKSLNTIKVDKATAYYVVKVTTDKGVRTEKVFVK